MNDFFEEVRAELAADRRRAAWQRLAPYVYGAAGLIILVTASHELYGVWRKNRIEESAQSFEAGFNAMREEKYDEARLHFDETLEKRGQFADLAAHFIAGMEIHAASASEQAEAANTDENLGKQQAEAARTAATALWQQAGTDNPLTRMASVKAAYLSADTMSLEELTNRLSGLIASGGEFSVLAREILAAKAFASGDVETARAQYTAIRSDETAWQEIRQRAHIALAMIKVTPPLTKSGPKTGASAPAPEDASDRDSPVLASPTLKLSDPADTP